MTFETYSDFVYNVTSDNSKDIHDLVRNIIVSNAENAQGEKDVIPHLLTAALGLCGEAAEVSSLLQEDTFDFAKLEDELGDVLWYIVQGSFALKTTLDEIHKSFVYLEDFKYSDSRLAIACGEFSDIVKKVVLHGKSYDEKYNDMYAKLVEIYGCTFHMINLTGSSIHQIMNLNMEKLSSRHPNGFQKDYKSDSQTG